MIALPGSTLIAHAFGFLDLVRLPAMDIEHHTAAGNGLKVWALCWNG